MKSMQPRIVTDDRVACAVFAGRIRPTLCLDLVKTKLASALSPVSNVYNCPAFALEPDCSSIISLQKPDEINCVIFLPEPIELGGKCDLSALSGKALNACRLINAAVKAEDEFIFDRFWIENTARCPN